MIMANVAPSYALPDLRNIPHHVTIEELAEVISNKTRRQDKKFFRVLIAHYLGVVASSMRAQISTNRGKIPINIYALALAPSGFGKGHSTYILENQVLQDFRKSFRDWVFPIQAENNMRKMASQRAVVNETEEDDEYKLLETELRNCGAYPFVFDGASEPAIKQIRQMLLIANSGSINFQVDEIGLNLEKSMEPLRVYLELYDQGLIKQKLTKNSSENKRTTEIEGKTPANALLFGTASKLLDGGPVEKMFYSMLDTGYARRCHFAWGQFMPGEDKVNEELSDAEMDAMIEQLYQSQNNAANDTIIDKWAAHLASLADPDKFGWTVEVPADIEKRLLRYQVQCEHQARALPEHEEIRKAEMEHRYYKALKLAGALAFIEEFMTMNEDHLYAAIKLTEESGEAFQALLSRESPYMKLARYIATCGREVTHSDLLEALPFYKGTAQVRSEMLTMATAWGYRKHIVIKKSFLDGGIEIFSGETLRETSLDAVRISYSDDFADGYDGEEVSFFDMENLALAPGFNWCNHWFQERHRADEKVIPGFNLVVLDIEDGVSLQMAHELLADYVFMSYTTKRHVPGADRFRIVLPINYELKLDKEDYRTFMNNLIDWLPFRGVDEASNQRSKKWLTNEHGQIHFNREGKLLDALPFVPKTSKNEQHNAETAKLKNLGQLERWFAGRFSEGSRNNHMIKFALALVDGGLSYAEIESRVLAFNAALPNGLEADELRNTVLVSVARKMQNTSP